MISVNAGLFPGGPWVMVLAALTAAVGGFLAWSCRRSYCILLWIGLSGTGSVLLAASLAGTDAAAVAAAGSAAWALSITALHLGGGLRQDGTHGWRSPRVLWENVLRLIGAAALAGAPFTLGFVSAAALMSGIAHGTAGKWGSIVAGGTLVGNFLLVPALARWLLFAESPAVETDAAPVSAPESSSEVEEKRIQWPSVGEAARAMGLGIPAALLLLPGLHPALLIGSGTAPSLGALLARPGLAGWGVWVGSLIGGGVLAWQDGFLRPKLRPALEALHDVLRLDWLYESVVGALRRSVSPFQAADELIGGAGALLWSCVLFLLIVLIWSGL
jgi:formate hydrogenlyase subunit 3/multisubunit Na+/H+ antiporter MnhD subunit